MGAGRLRRAHVAVALAFVAFGTVDGTWVARLPALKQPLGLDSGELGLVIFSVSLAETVLLPVSGWLTSRRGIRGPTALGLLVTASALTAAAFAPSLHSLVASACLLGAGFSIVDVAANAHGVAVEQRLGRPVLSALHGAWSFGLLAGSGIAAGAAATGVGVRAQFPAVSIGVVVAAIVLVPRLLPSAEDAALDTAHFALPRGALALPALLTFCSMFVESAAMNWSAVFLSGPAHASAAVGAGCAALVPALFRVAAAAPGVSSGAGIAAVATAGYTGGVVNGPAIGFLARGVGLTAALSLVGVAGLLIAVLGPRLRS